MNALERLEEFAENPFLDMRDKEAMQAVCRALRVALEELVNDVSGFPKGSPEHAWHEGRLDRITAILRGEDDE